MINFALVLQLSFGGLPCRSVELSLCGAVDLERLCLLM
jgi:hypothetical protein